MCGFLTVAIFAQAALSKSMADSQQDVLRSAWFDAKAGSLSGREQAKAWALREIWRDSGKADHGMKSYIAGKLEKKGGGSPSSEAVRRFFEKVDADDDWFPGKGNYDDMGAPPVMTGQQRASIARCAMIMKKAGTEPTYSRVVAACPKAALNPKTQRPFSKDTVYHIMHEDCYDDDPFLPWQHKARFSKKALTTDMMQRRLKFADYVLDLHHNDAWFFNRLVWTDLCNSIIPLSEKKANEMALACKSKKGWMSPGCEMSAENSKGHPEALKQKSWNTMRIWWFPMLANLRPQHKVETACPGVCALDGIQDASPIHGTINAGIHNTQKGTRNATIMDSTAVPVVEAGRRPPT